MAMTWQRLDNGDYMAEGESGDFLIWKDDWGWKSRYRSKDKVRHFFLPKVRYLADAKKQCEKNHFWER